MPVGDKSSVGKGLEGKEGRRRGKGNRRRRHIERPQVGRGKFRAYKKRQGRGGRVEEPAGGRGEDSISMGAKEGRDPHERVRPRWVRDEVAGDRQKFVREGELTGEMGGATDFKG